MKWPARSPVVPFYPFLEGSPTKIDQRKKGTLIRTSLLEDLEGGTYPNSLQFSYVWPRLASAPGSHDSMFVEAAGCAQPVFLQRNLGGAKWASSWMTAKGRQCETACFEGSDGSDAWVNTNATILTLF